MLKIKQTVGLSTKLVLFLFSSWVIVHLISIFGFFVALAYPFWWMVSPNSTPCFVCKAKIKSKGYCCFCKKEVMEGVPTNPESIRSVLLNSALITFFTVFSFLAVLFEGYLINNYVFSEPEKTVSFMFPANGQHRLYEVFPMKVEVVGIKDTINAIQADIGFDPLILRVVDITTKGSFANIFVQKEIDNVNGYARISGGLPNPGYSDRGGVFATFYFEAIGTGVAKVEFLPSSLVLANDGKGTNVLKELSSASYLVFPEEVTPEEREGQAKLIGQSEGLDADDNKVQLHFYDEKGSHAAVLGEAVSQKEDDKDFLKTISDFIYGLDRFIVSFWGYLLYLLIKPRALVRWM